MTKPLRRPAKISCLITVIFTGILSCSIARADDTRFYKNVSSLSTCFLNIAAQAAALDSALVKVGGRIPIEPQEMIKNICLKASDLVVDGLSWPMATSIASKQLVRELMRR